MTIGILGIFIGKYTIFWEIFYNSINTLFLPNHKKKFFIFTDDINLSSQENVILHYQEKLGWPYDTMYRFKMFNRIRSSLLTDTNYLYFFNANMEVLMEITEQQVVPLQESVSLVGVIHPGYYSQDRIHFPYERRQESSLFLSHSQGKFYYQGCLNGGETSEFLTMSEILENKIDIDLSKNITPVWHDESAINWYYHDKNVLTLDPGFAYPEDERALSTKINFKKRILQVSKVKYGDATYLRI